MLKWLKTNWKQVIIFVVVFVVVIPLIINWAFKQDWGIELLKAEWSVDSALTFYGSMVAAFIAVYGVFLTIQYSQKNYKEDVRNRTLPFINIEVLRTQVRYNLFEDYTQPKDNSNFSGYIEYKPQNHYFIIDYGEIKYQTKLTEEQKKLLNEGGIKNINEGNEISYVDVHNICIPIEIENIGNGTAVNFRYCLKRINTPDKKKEYGSIFSLKQSCPMIIHIFSEDCGKNSKNLGDYELAFYYEDIFGNQYTQKINIKIFYEGNAAGFEIEMCDSNKQELIGGK